MIKFIKKLLVSFREPKINTGDPMKDEVILRAFKTGKMVLANRDEDGKVTIVEKDI